MEVSGQLHALAALPPVPIIWAPDTEKMKGISIAMNRRVAIPTELSDPVLS
jgi:hypothetical protein